MKHALIAMCLGSFACWIPLGNGTTLPCQVGNDASCSETGMTLGDGVCLPTRICQCSPTTTLFNGRCKRPGDGGVPGGFGGGGFGGGGIPGSFGGGGGFGGGGFSGGGFGGGGFGGGGFGGGGFGGAGFGGGGFVAAGGPGGGTTTAGGGNSGGGAVITCTTIHTNPRTIENLGFEGPNRLSVRTADSNFFSAHQLLDFSGALLPTPPDNAHANSGFAVRAWNGRDLTLLFGGGFSTALEVSYVQSQTSMWTRTYPLVQPTADYTKMAANHDPLRDEFALFWNIQSFPERRLAMQLRYGDGGIGFTNTSSVPDNLSTKHGADWAPGRYVVAGLRQLHLLGTDGVLRQSLPLSGVPTAVATDRADRAGVLVQGTDGGALTFTQVDNTNGAMIATDVPILSNIMMASADTVWDPVLGGWHIALTEFVRPMGWGQVRLATVMPGQGLVSLKTLVGCSSVGTVGPVALQGRSLFIAVANFTGSGNTIVRVDL